MVTLEQLLDEIELKMTCCACPEQYDAVWSDKVVGYLRLRWGTFRVRFPNASGEIIYSSYDCEGDGIFIPDERQYYLDIAHKAIAKKLLERLLEA